MKYDIHQSTAYSYASSVPVARHVVRMVPVDRPNQRVVASHFVVEPEPVEWTETRDFFGNKVVHIRIETPHRSFTVKTRARVEVEAPAEIAADAGPSWEEAREAADESLDLSALSPAHFLFPSPAVPLSAPITEWTAESFPPGRPMLAACVELMNRLYEEFTYDPRATDVSTPPLEAFELRAGVCQDFAHIMIAGLRGLGLPAAYVSGFLRTEPPPGKERLQGADATHAWVMVWCGEAIGWQGLDPTNALVVATDHVVLAVGRDYTDVAPIGGVVFGSGKQKLNVEVDVIPLAEEAAAGKGPASPHSRA
ncbi:transglutaminase family protein [Ancylobacter dichloromethanicus]|uniref:Transglutaminase n=1 Tax=Ancylobacter dichloromethanicus TaxID=518825 RepID=A0A9W6JEF1_9HYPH|nr:transglutaminase family protein [Ancylobacter dichloromethanicus]MBS7553379.1 transglutaminase family protein [Ancylobacter dichloromethanicus]GLK74300.1 transglutaminase [Ancylobacter dichloromethanicus]